MSTYTSESRDANGRFSKGNPGGPGNPYGRRLAANRAAILKAVSEEEIAALIRTLLVRAMEGDMAAAKLVLQYVIGKPQAMKNPDLVDVDEFQVAKAKRVPHAQAVIALLDMPVEKATEMAGQTPQRAPYDPEEAKLDEAEEREEAAVHDAEARRALAHMLETGSWPADSAFAQAEKNATTEEVAEFRRYLARAFREGKLPNDGPFKPFDDGDAGAKTGRRPVPQAVCPAA